MILNSPVLLEGNGTLCCPYKKTDASQSVSDSNATFYRNHDLITKSEGKLILPALTKTDEGKCQILFTHTVHQAFSCVRFSYVIH